jgi:hypothetical protein
MRPRRDVGEEAGDLAKRRRLNSVLSDEALRETIAWERAVPSKKEAQPGDERKQYRRDNEPRTASTKVRS